MAVGADHHVGMQRNAVRARLLADDRGQLLQVDGVHDAGARRMDAHVGQRLGGPTQETVALGVTAQFQVQVLCGGVGLRVGFDRQRMVHRDVHGQHGVQQGGVAAGFGQRVAHGGDVHQGRRAGGVVHQHAAGLEGDLGVAGAVVQPTQ
ncbi:hypothetical protein D3C86_1309430 [compost metagenome]